MCFYVILQNAERIKMGSIEISKSEVKMDISVFLYKDGDIFNAYCPELDLVGCDYTLDGARASFDVVLSDYIEHTVKHGTLEQDLLSHGRRKTREGKVAKPLTSTMMRSQQMKNVFSKREFSKYSVPVAL